MARATSTTTELRVRAGLPMPNWASSISQGEAAAVSLNTLNSINPCTSPPCVYTGNGYHGMVDAWTSGVYAADLGNYGSLLCWGGGDGDYWGTQVSCWDLETQLWTRLDNPTTWMNGLGYSADPPGASTPGFDSTWGEHVPQIGALGIPAVPHDYDGLAFLPAGSAYGGTLGRIFVPARYAIYKQGANGQSHYYDLASRSWTRYSASPMLSPIGGPCCCYDSKRERVWVSDSARDGQWIGYSDLASHTQNRASTGFYTHLAMVWHYLPDPRDRIIVFGVHYSTLQWSIFVIDPNTAMSGGAWTAVTINGTRPVPTNSALGIAYCDDLDCFYCYDEAIGKMKTLWKIQPPATGSLTTQPWTSTQITIGPTSLTIDGGYVAPNGMYKRLSWAKKIRRLLWYSSVSTPVYAYRPAEL